jgi:hypothetical protein
MDARLSAFIQRHLCLNGVLEADVEVAAYATVCISPLVKSKGIGHCPTRHGDVVFQLISSFVAQSVDLSV